MEHVNTIGTIFLSFIGLCFMAGVWCSIEIALDPTGDGDTWLLQRLLKK